MRPTHNPRGMLLLSLLAVTIAALAASPASRAAEPRRPVEYINGVPDTGQFLPNSAILARVADRRVSVLAFRDAYFASDPHIRPSGDSLGRAEFLTNMVRKDVLGLTALSAGYTLNFEDRAKLREVRSKALSNRFFETAVLDVPPVSEDSLRRVYEYYRYELRMRLLQFTDRAVAEAAQRSLAQGRASWATFAARYTPSGLQQSEGQFNWSRFENLPTDLGLALWRLKPGQLSPVLRVPGGYQVYQVTERRDRAVPEFGFLRPAIVDALKNHESDLRRRAITDEAKRDMNVRFDTTNVIYTSKLFPVALRTGEGNEIMIDETLPEIAAEDTSRTLIEWDGGRVSLGRLTHAYSDLPAVMRPRLDSPDRVVEYAEAIMLEPKMLEMAIARGLEQDTVVVARYQRKLEEILVGKMVEDSCFSRITVSQKERRDYYQKNRPGYMTFPSVRYAVVVRDTRAAADSVKARLDAGEPIASVLRADSLRGETRSGIQEANSNSNLSYQKILFEEMRAGQSRVMGPDRANTFACMHLLSFDPGQLLPYEQVETLVDESVRNLKAEKALNDFVARLMRRFPIEVHYDLLPRVKLTTPGPDERE